MIIDGLILTLSFEIDDINIKSLHELFMWTMRVMYSRPSLPRNPDTSDLYPFPLYLGLS